MCDSLKLIPKLGFDRFDLVFLDPPYALKLIPAVLNSLIANNKLKPTSIIVCESATEADVFCGDANLESLFEIKKKAKYGAAFVTIMEPKEVNL